MEQVPGWYGVLHSGKQVGQGMRWMADIQRGVEDEILLQSNGKHNSMCNPPWRVFSLSMGC